MIHMRSVVWFNNYGMREFTPSAGKTTYHWGPTFQLCTHVLANIVTLNGATCITLGSTTIPQAELEKMLAKMKEMMLNPKG